MMPQWVIASLVLLLTNAGWCDGARAFRPFDGTDTAVADTGKIEVELGPVEYRRESAARTLFAPSRRINYGFAPDWEAVVEGRVAHGLSGDSRGTGLVQDKRDAENRIARRGAAGEARPEHRDGIWRSAAFAVR